MSMVAFSVVVYALMWWYFGQENKKRAEGKRDERMEGLNEEEIAALGDDNPRYIFSR